MNQVVVLLVSVMALSIGLLRLATKLSMEKILGTTSVLIPLVIIVYSAGSGLSFRNYFVWYLLWVAVAIWGYWNIPRVYSFYLALGLDTQRKREKELKDLDDSCRDKN